MANRIESLRKQLFEVRLIIARAQAAELDLAYLFQTEINQVSMANPMHVSPAAPVGESIRYLHQIQTPHVTLQRALLHIEAEKWRWTSEWGMLKYADLATLRLLFVKLHRLIGD